MKKILLIVLGLFLICPVLVYAANQPVEQPGAKPTYNQSAVIVTGNTFQTVLPIVTRFLGRLALTIQNNNTTDSCWLSFGTFGSTLTGVFSGTLITAGNATKGRSIVLLPGGSLTRYWPFVPSDEIEATCTTTADTLYVDVM